MECVLKARLPQQAENDGSESVCMPWASSLSDKFPQFELAGLLRASAGEMAVSHSRPAHGADELEIMARSLLTPAVCSITSYSDPLPHSCV